MDSVILPQQSIVDYYKLLECERTATTDDLKKSYQRLILSCHPDKTGCNNEKFLLIQKAWAVIKDPEKRKIYDATLSCHEESEYLLYDTISLSDMNSASDGYFSYSCRCGGSYLLDPDVELKQSVIIPCDECSFSIEVGSNGKSNDGS